MMKVIYTMLYFSCLYLGLTHDAPIAMFKLSDMGDYTALHISIDAEDLSNSINQPVSDIGLKNVKDYLNENFDIQINAEFKPLSLSSFNLKMDHIHVQGSIDTPISIIKKIKIRNTCLLEIDDQSNIVQFKYDDRIRDFRMSKDRREIEVEMN